MKFEPDYLIGWDISKNGDFPAITVVKLSAEKDKVVCTVLGVSHEPTGVVSLRQLIEQSDALKSAKNEE